MATDQTGAENGHRFFMTEAGIFTVPDFDPEFWNDDFRALGSRFLEEFAGETIDGQSEIIIDGFRYRVTESGTEIVLDPVESADSERVDKLFGKRQAAFPVQIIFDGRNSHLKLIGRKPARYQEKELAGFWLEREDEYDDELHPLFQRRTVEVVVEKGGAIPIGEMRARSIRVSVTSYPESGDTMKVELNVVEEESETATPVIEAALDFHREGKLAFGLSEKTYDSGLVNETIEKAKNLCISFLPCLVNKNIVNSSLHALQT